MPLKKTKHTPSTLPFPPLRTCTIITTTPNAAVAPIHNRMAVVLRREDEPRWLAPDLPADARKAMLAPYPSELRAYRVPQRVGKVTNQDAGVIEAI